MPPVVEVKPPAFEAAGEWTAIQGTTSLAVLAKFQERFPDPPWHDYAEARANELRSADAERKAQDATSVRPEGPGKTSWPLILGGAAIFAVGALAVMRPREPMSTIRQSNPTDRATATVKTEPVAAVVQPRTVAPTPQCTGTVSGLIGTGTVCLDPANAAKREFQDCASGSCGPQMVALPTGRYKRGSEDGGSDEKPVREVSIGYHLAVGKYEVTFTE